MIIRQKSWFIYPLILWLVLLGENNLEVTAQTPQCTPVSESISALSDSNATILGIWENPIVEDVKDLAVKDDRLYLLNGSKGLYILDISNPSSPVILDSCILSGYIGCLTIHEGFAYIINDGLRIVDVSDSHNPIVEGHWPGASGDDIVIQDDLAFIPAGQSSRAYLHIIDVSDKSNPVEKGNFYAGPGDLDKLDVHGDFAYVGRDYTNAGVEFDFLSINVSDPENPEEAGKYDGSWDFSSWQSGVNRSYTDMFVENSKLYATHQYCGFGVFDVLDPANPVEAGFYRGNMSALSVEGDYAYALDYDDEDAFRILDIRNPSAPSLVGYYNIGGLVDADIAVQNGVVYIAAGDLYVIRNGLITDVDAVPDFEPNPFFLTGNYPNPFNPATTIAFTIRRKSPVTLKVYDINGREIQTLMDQILASGRYEVQFDGNDCPSGIYLYRIQTSGFHEMRKMMLIK